MSEIKQANFRVNQDTIDQFRAFCEEKGLTQAQGFDHLMQVWTLNEAKLATPGRLTEIEEFEKNIKAITAAYIGSLEIANGTEERVLEQFKGRLQSKDETISNLQKEMIKLKDEHSFMTGQLKKAEKIQEDDEEKIALLNEAIKDTRSALAHTTVLFEEAQKKANAYDEALSAKNDAQAQLKEATNQVEKDRLDLSKQAKEIQDLEEKIFTLESQITAANQTLSMSREDCEHLREKLITETNRHAQELETQELKAQQQMQEALMAQERAFNEKLLELSRENAKLTALLDVKNQE